MVPVLGRDIVFRLSVGKGVSVKYNQITLGQVEAILNKLGGMEGAEAFLRGEYMLTKVPTPNALVALMFTRDFAIDINIVGMDVVHAIGGDAEIQTSVVQAMPRATVRAGKLHFFQTGRVTLAEELEAEANLRGLTLADPHTLAGFNREHKEFASTYTNATQWQDSQGGFCYAFFAGRRVEFIRGRGKWLEDIWFAGVSAN